MPLPKNDGELESFRTGFSALRSGIVIDATDLDKDGVWEDSYGNVVTYFAPLHYQGNGPEDISYNYQYMTVKEEDRNLFFNVASNTHRRWNGLLAKWFYTELQGHVFCQLPLDPPTQEVYEPPTPVEGEKISSF